MEIGISEAITFQVAFESVSAHLLFDAKLPGSGKPFDWHLIKGIRLHKPWFLAGGLTPENVAVRVAKRARIYASPGEQFGPGGNTWLRFNFATPRPILEDALGRLEDAFADLRGS